MTIVVEPDPAAENGQVTVTADGSGPYYYRASGGGEWQVLPLDPETGKATISVPGSPPQTLDVSDRGDGVPDTTSVSIVNSN